MIRTEYERGMEQARNEAAKQRYILGVRAIAKAMRERLINPSEYLVGGKPYITLIEQGEVMKHAGNLNGGTICGISAKDITPNDRIFAALKPETQAMLTCDECRKRLGLSEKEVTDA